MTFEDWYRRATEGAVDMEKLLLGLMFVSSTYMVWDTFNFTSSSAARFPRLTAGTVLVGSLLLLVSGFLPERFRSAIAESSEVFQADEEVVEQQEKVKQRSEAEAAERGAEPRTAGSDISVVGRPIHDSLFTALATVGYGLLAYAIGIFLATPVFVALYTWWFRSSWFRIVGLSALGTLIAYTFVWALNIPLDRGEIFFTDGVISQFTVLAPVML